MRGAAATPAGVASRADSDAAWATASSSGGGSGGGGGGGGDAARFRAGRLKKPKPQSKDSIASQLAQLGGGIGRNSGADVNPYGLAFESEDTAGEATQQDILQHVSMINQQVTRLLSDYEDPEEGERRMEMGYLRSNVNELLGRFHQIKDTQVARLDELRETISKEGRTYKDIERLLGGGEMEQALLLMDGTKESLRGIFGCLANMMTEERSLSRDELQTLQIQILKSIQRIDTLQVAVHHGRVDDYQGRKILLQDPSLDEIEEGTDLANNLQVSTDNLSTTLSKRMALENARRNQIGGRSAAPAKVTVGVDKFCQTDPLPPPKQTTTPKREPPPTKESPKPRSPRRAARTVAKQEKANPFRSNKKSSKKPKPEPEPEAEAKQERAPEEEKPEPESAEPVVVTKVERVEVLPPGAMLKEDIDEMKRDLIEEHESALRAATDKLKQELSEEKKRTATEHVQRERLESRCGELDETVASLTAQNEQSEVEKSTLRQQLQDLQDELNRKNAQPGKTVVNPQVDPPAKQPRLTDAKAVPLTRRALRDIVAHISGFAGDVAKDLESTLAHDRDLRAALAAEEKGEEPTSVEDKTAKPAPKRKSSTTRPSRTQTPPEPRKRQPRQRRPSQMKPRTPPVRSAPQPRAPPKQPEPEPERPPTPEPEIIYVTKVVQPDPVPTMTQGTSTEDLDTTEVEQARTQKVVQKLAREFSWYSPSNADQCRALVEMAHKWVKGRDAEQEERTGKNPSIAAALKRSTRLAQTALRFRKASRSLSQWDLNTEAKESEASGRPKFGRANTVSDADSAGSPSSVRPRSQSTNTPPPSAPTPPAGAPVDTVATDSVDPSAKMLARVVANAASAAKETVEEAFPSPTAATDAAAETKPVATTAEPPSTTPASSKAASSSFAPPASPAEHKPMTPPSSEQHGGPPASPVDPTTGSSNSATTASPTAPPRLEPGPSSQSPVAAAIPDIVPSVDTQAVSAEGSTGSPHMQPPVLQTADGDRQHNQVHEQGKLSATAAGATVIASSASTNTATTDASVAAVSDNAPAADTNTRGADAMPTTPLSIAPPSGPDAESVPSPVAATVFSGEPLALSDTTSAMAPQTITPSVGAAGADGTSPEAEAFGIDEIGDDGSLSDNFSASDSESDIAELGNGESDEISLREDTNPLLELLRMHESALDPFWRRRLRYVVTQAAGVPNRAAAYLLAREVTGHLEELAGLLGKQHRLVAECDAALFRVRDVVQAMDEEMTDMQEHAANVDGERGWKAYMRWVRWMQSPDLSDALMQLSRSYARARATQYSLELGAAEVRALLGSFSRHDGDRIFGVMLEDTDLHTVHFDQFREASRASQQNVMRVGQRLRRVHNTKAKLESLLSAHLTKCAMDMEQHSSAIQLLHETQSTKSLRNTVMEAMEKRIQEMVLEIEQLKAAAIAQGGSADDSARGALTFFAILGAPHGVEALEKLCHHLEALQSAALGERSREQHFSYADFNMHLKSFAGCLPALQQIRNRYHRLRRKWSHQRSMVYYERNLAGGDADASLLCPLCGTDTRTREVPVADTRGLEPQDGSAQFLPTASSSSSSSVSSVISPIRSRAATAVPRGKGYGGTLRKGLPTNTASASHLPALQQQQHVQSHLMQLAGVRRSSPSLVRHSLHGHHH